MLSFACCKHETQGGARVEEAKANLMNDAEEPEEWRMAMGFPSPADIYRQGRLDLNRQLIRHPSATFFARMQGERLADERIHDGDLLVIDRAEPILPGQVVVVRVGQEMLVRKLERIDGRMYLFCSDQSPVELTPDLDWEFWGRIIFSIKKH